MFKNPLQNYVRAKNIFTNDSEHLLLGSFCLEFALEHPACLVEESRVSFVDTKNPSPD